MAKDPAFLFYPGDWLGGTIGMTFEQKGAYMELLMMQFTRGHMTTHMIGQVVGQHWDTLKDKFKQDENGLWYNERLDIEKEKRKNFVNSRKNNISGENQHTKKPKNKSDINGHMTTHMENRNEDVINNRLEYYKDKIECFNEWQSNERLIEEILMLIQKFGFTSANRIHVINIFRNFLLVEFSITKTKSDHEHHLRRWVNKMGKKIHEYAS
jgi:uncharacterized protein YdaU (DUF1376 family)